MTRRLCTALFASLLLLATACGTTDDDKADEKATTTTAKPDDDTSKTEDGDDGSSTTEDDGSGGDGSNPEFCEAAAELNTLFDDLEDDDYQGLVDAIKDAEGAFDTYVDKIPEEMKDEAEMLVQSLKTLAAEVDKVKDDPDAAEKVQAAATALQSEEIETAGDTVNEYEDATCPDA